MKKSLILIGFILAIVLVGVFFGGDKSDSPIVKSKEISTETLSSQNPVNPPQKPPTAPIGLESSQEDPNNSIKTQVTDVKSISTENPSPNTDVDNDNEPKGVYTLKGQACNQNLLDSSCELFLDSQKIITLKSCQSDVDDGCNLYFYSLQKETSDELFIFKEFTNTENIKFLEVMSLNKSTNQLKTINTFINDPGLPQTIGDYEKAKNLYQQ